MIRVDNNNTSQYDDTDPDDPEPRPSTSGAAPSVVDLTGDPSTAPSVPTALSGATAASVPLSSAAGTRAKNPFTVAISNESNATAAASIKEKLSTKVAKAEIKLALGVIETGMSYSAMETLLPILKGLDPDSKVLAGITLMRNKVSYVISDSLGPFFHEKHIQLARQAPAFSLALDCATSKRGGLSKDLDIHLTFWNSEREVIETHLLEIIEMTTETAEVLLTRIEGCLSENGLPMKNMLAVSRDNPNVNKSLMKMLTEKGTKEGHKILDYGSCVLHVSHNAFSKGLKIVPINVSELAKCIYGFFKYSTIRREQFTAEILDLERDEKLRERGFLRHVDSRWLSLKPALERIDKHWEAILHYFLVTIPALARDNEDKNVQKNAKDAMKTKYYELVATKLKQPDCRFWVKLIIFICERFYPFLTKMQSSGPQIASLYMDCSSLLLDVMSCLIKQSAIPGQGETKKLTKMDLSKDNLELPKMSPSAMTIYRSLTSVDQNNAKKAACAVYKKIGQYLQINLKPLNSTLVRSLRVLNPKNCEGLPDGGKAAIILAAKALGRLSNAQVDSLALQWELFGARRFTRKCDSSGKPSEGIDCFYARCFKELSSEREKFKELELFVMLSLSLPCGNAAGTNVFLWTNITKYLHPATLGRFLRFCLCFLKVTPEIVYFTNFYFAYFYFAYFYFAYFYFAYFCPAAIVWPTSLQNNQGNFLQNLGNDLMLHSVY